MENKDSSLIFRLQQDIRKSLLSGEKQRTEALRYLYSLLQKEESRQGKLTGDKQIGVLRAEMKRKRDALKLFKKGGRKDLAEVEQREIEILSEYLPKQANEKEIEKVVAEIIDRNEEIDFGRIMSDVMSRFQGRADGSLVAGIVKKKIRQLTDEKK